MKKCKGRACVDNNFFRNNFYATEILKNQSGCFLYSVLWAVVVLPWRREHYLPCYSVAAQPINQHQRGMQPISIRLLPASVNCWTELNTLIKCHRRFQTSVIGLCRHAGRAFYFDWIINSFIMVVYENVFSYVMDRKFWLNLKKVLINNHYKIIKRPVRSECSSCRVSIPFC